MHLYIFEVADAHVSIKCSIGKFPSDVRTLASLKEKDASKPERKEKKKDKLLATAVLAQPANTIACCGRRGARRPLPVASFRGTRGGLFGPQEAPTGGSGGA